MVTELLTFAEACAHPNAKRLMFHGLTGPVNAVEVDGTFFIEGDEAKAKEVNLKALELASEVAMVSKAAAAAAAAAVEVAAAPTPMPKPVAALDSEPFCSAKASSASAVHRISYSAAASKPPVGPKPSTAGFEVSSVVASKFSAGLKCSTPTSQPAVVIGLLEVSTCIMSMHVK